MLTFVQGKIGEDAKSDGGTTGVIPLGFFSKIQIHH